MTSDRGFAISAAIDLIKEEEKLSGPHVAELSSPRSRLSISTGEVGVRRNECFVGDER